MRISTWEVFDELTEIPRSCFWASRLWCERSKCPIVFECCRKDEMKVSKLANSAVRYVSTAALLTSQPARMEEEASGACILWWPRLSASCSRWCSIWPVYLLRRRQRRSVGFQTVWARTCCVWMLIVPADPHWVTASRTAATRALFIRLPHFTILRGFAGWSAAGTWGESWSWCLSSAEKLEVWLVSADLKRFYLGMKSRSPGESPLPVFLLWMNKWNVDSVAFPHSDQSAWSFTNEGVGTRNDEDAWWT